MDLRGYAAARESCARADGSDRGWLEFAGPDARDFLQRVLTSDLRGLRPGAGQWSALLDGKGHWISDLLLYCLDGASDDAFGMDLPADRAEAVSGRLEALHFAERFALERPDAARSLLLGPGAEDVARGLGLPAPSAGSGLGVASAGGLRVLRRPDRGAPALEILGAPARIRAIEERLVHDGVPRADAAALETLRVEAFQPRWGADFDEETTLPDSNEWRRASLTKGCYAGQEVIARVNTYGEAPRQLCRLRFEGTGDAPLSGAELDDGSGRVLGRVTSWAWSPSAERALGLGVVRRRAARTGERLQVRRDGASGVAVVEVPEKVLG